MTSSAAAVPGPQARQSPAGAGSGPLSHRQILVIFSGLMLGLFLAALDQTIVSVSIRTIADDLKGLSLQAWVTTAYLITATISTPLYGKLSDLYGRKPLFLFSISVFVLGSLLCSFSNSMHELTAFRAFQGIGAGGLFALALAIIGDIAPPRERARYQGYFVAVFGTSSVLGPVIGGALAGQDSILSITGWRWVFLVNVPIGFAAFAVVARVLNIPHTRREHRIDWAGALALVVALVPLLTVAQQGREWGWGSHKALACYIVASLGLIVFLLAERLIGDDALLPLRLFRNSVFSVTSLAGVIIGMGLFGGIAVLPLYLQIVKGASPTKAGLLTVPLVVGIMASSIVAGQIIAKTGRYKVFPVIGTALMGGALLAMHYRINADTPLWEVDLYMLAFGAGLGGCLQTLMLAVQNAVPPRDMGVASSSATFFRQLGGTLGTAVFLSILFSTVATRIGNAFRAIVPSLQFQAAAADPAVSDNPANRAVLQAIQSGDIRGLTAGVLQDSSVIQQVDPRLARPFAVGFADSIETVFLVGACVMAVGFVVILFLKEIPLRTESGLDARAAELAAESAAASVAPTAAEAIDADRPSPNTLPDPAQEAWRPPEGAPAPAVNGQPPARVLVSTSGESARHTADMPLGAGGVDPADRLLPGPGTGPGGDDHQADPVIFGRVSGSGGAPLAGATLTLTDLAGRQLDRNASDTSGHYQLGPPSGGTYLVICASLTHRPRAALVAVADIPVRHDVVLSGGGSTLTGTVHMPGTGQDVGGAVVTLTDVHGDVTATTTTGSDGRYTFTDLTEGDYTLTVASTNLSPVAQSISLPAEGHVHHDFEVAVRAQLVGTVRSAGTGAPVPEALATLVDSDGNVVGSVITGSNGGFVFDDLNVGAYTVIATGYPPVAADVLLGVGGPTETVLTLRPAILTGADGAAVEDQHAQ
ncbi:MAG TPA: DHA2 family efflux MFS transporter permease subunit [Mycobacteriales bacterium]|nr:DHA2 family efflux MFS transporter permease subunit [Mycobacteriales bacterium]